VTPELAADAAALGRLGLGDSGWPDFAMYYPLSPIAERGRRSTAPRCPATRRGRRSREGAAAVFAGDAARFGLTVRLIPRNRRRGRPNSRRPIATRCPTRSCRVSSRRSACATPPWPRPRCRARGHGRAGRGRHGQRPRAHRLGRPGAARHGGARGAVFALGQFEAEPADRCRSTPGRRRPRGPAGPLRGIPLIGRRAQGGDGGHVLRPALPRLCSASPWPGSSLVLAVPMPVSFALLAWPDPLFRHARGGGSRDVSRHVASCRPRPSRWRGR
jgi:hypothetical protein